MPRFFIPITKFASILIRTRPELRFRSGTGFDGIWAGTGSGRFGRYQTGTAIFYFAGLYFFLFFTNYIPASRAPSSSLAGSRAPIQFPNYHALPSSSLAVSRAPLQFPGCITCSPPVPWLYHVLPSNSKTVLRATLQFPKCITCQQSLYFLLNYYITCPPLYPLLRHLER